MLLLDKSGNCQLIRKLHHLQRVFKNVSVGIAKKNRSTYVYLWKSSFKSV